MYIDIVGLLKILIINLLTNITALKLINKKTNKIKNIMNIVIISVIYFLCKNYISIISGTIFLIFLITFSLQNITNDNFFYTIMISIISFSINEVIFVVSSTIVFYICKFFYVTNEYVIFAFIMSIDIILIFFTLKIQRIQKGIEFLKNKSNYELLEILLLNIGIVIIFSIILITNYTKGITEKTGIAFIVFSITMFMTIQKSIQLYYKQKLLVQDLNETKKELEIKTKEIQTLEQENLSYSKKAHSLEHKLKSLENKINKLTYNQEITKEIGIDKQIKDISNQIHNQMVYVELDKTGIEEIDDMLDTMRNEAIKNNIEFNLQLKGNIYQMINNYIDKQDLAILLADHIKDAIIAINHTENINKSILVRLGKIDNCFALYIYDTGVEFKKEVLDNLGKIPITTYKEEGGTGMGFMNTFDTLNKTKASLTIKQIGPPSKDNYTKVIMITFDGKHEFKII